MEVEISQIGGNLQEFFRAHFGGKRSHYVEWVVRRGVAFAELEILPAGQDAFH